MKTRLPTRLDQILTERLFRPVFQPVVDLREGRTVGFEALTRMDDGQPILEVLRQAEELGIRPDLEILLLEAALEQARHIGDSAWVSVNISPSVLLDYCDTVSSLIDRSSIPVVLELTENEAITDYHEIRRALMCLAPTTRLCLDDIGTGYAYLRHVVRMQADYIKLDHMWTARLSTDPAVQLVVTALLEICQQFGITFIAEGIETSDHLSTVKTLGVSYGQGYLFGHPGPLPALGGAESVHPRDSDSPRSRRRG